MIPVVPAQPAPEKITDKIFGETTSISEIKMGDIPDIDLSKPGVHKFGDFEVEVVDSVADYLTLLKQVFDFDLLRKFLSRPDFKFKFDAMWAVTGAYAGPILVDALGASPDSIKVRDSSGWIPSG